MSTQGKLLIVDDELSVRDSLGKWFREEGYEVTTLENANDALTQLATQRWDAALVDIKMHGTDGIELQRRMHEIDPDLMVIIMTGYASVETAVKRLSAMRLVIGHLAIFSSRKMSSPVEGSRAETQFRSAKRLLLS